MSVQIAKVKGIPIKLHFTLIIVFALVTWTLASGFMPRFYPNLDSSSYWIMGIAGAIVLFMSVLLHELAHSLLSLKYGIRVRQIILFIFGGISDIKEETKDYKKEFKIAAIGPITSFGLAFVFAMVCLLLIQFGGQSAMPIGASTMQDSMETNTEGTGTLQREETTNPFQAIPIISGIMIYASIINALLGLFNLIPAFPLDGGRMLRAGLIKWKKSYIEATRIAVRVGVGISFGLMAFGFITILTGSTLGGFWFIIIGWFIQSGAQTYLQQQEISTALVGVRLKDIMNTKFISVRQNQTVAEVLRDYFNIYRKSEFPVLDAEGHLVGAITSQQAMGISENDAQKVTIEKIMIPKKELVIMNANSRADEALKRIYQRNKNRVFVCDDNDYDIMREQDITPQNSESLAVRTNITLLGIISKSDLLNIASEREEFDRLANR
ncbi:MAG TPA: site-2 protease family protein [Phototrophicaceae bacterium]|nr:site-2 protease family protein [Phototrophicaceae bacterium]